MAGICVGAVVVWALMRQQRRRKAKGTAAAMIEARHGNGESHGVVGEVNHVGGEQWQSLQRKTATEMEGGYPAAHELHGAPGLYEMPVHDQ
ncbi:hypothetical protein VPNG_03506 [Cytospora leucostoma]|uniref:Uncharacterized protein n=1 Tax=Cytospora leucostoma TaxID=1230097 RepID=A0A423XCR9_9PEZI|nr:hypothetical protein VPNG_03506 [Cytospora leucostoma]